MLFKNYLLIIIIQLAWIIAKPEINQNVTKFLPKTNDSLQRLIIKSTDLEEKQNLIIELINNNTHKNSDFVIDYIKNNILTRLSTYTDPLFLSQIYNSYGTACALKQKLREADAALKLGINLAEKIDNEFAREVLLDLKSNEAVVYGMQGFKNIELQKISELQPLLLRIKNKNLVLNGYLNLGIIYYNNNNLEKAISTFQKCRSQLSNSEILEHHRGIVEILIASAYQKLNDIDSVRKYIKIANQNASEQLLTDYKSRMKSLQGLVAAYENKFDEAYQLIEKARVLGIESKDRVEKLYPFIIKAKCLILQKEYAKASAQLAELINDKENDELDDYKESMMKTLIEVYRLNGENKKAMDVYEGLLRFLSKQEKLNTEMHIQELDYNFKYNEKLFEIEKLKAANESSEITKQRNVVFIFSLILLLVLVLTFMGVIIVNHRRKKNSDDQKYLLLQANIEEERKNRIIDEMTLSRKIEERERNRIATDLHDSVGGLLSSMRISFFEIEDRHSFNEDALKEANRILSYIDESKQELNRIVYNLTPLAVKNFGLLEAIKQYGKKIQTPSLHVHLQLLSISPKISNADEITLYRVIQELLNNIVKHAEANYILLQIQSNQKGQLVLTIEDNGKGMDTSQTYTGLGMHSLQARVQQLNGSIKIESEKGNGTRVYIVCKPKSVQI